jgi:methyl-accepting chemotaxis protein
MGNLAKASGEASKEIETILNNGVEKTKEQIKLVTSDLEKVTTQTINHINLISGKTDELSNRFDQLSQYSKETEEKAKQISNATAEQNIGVQEIASALQALETTSAELEAMSIRNHSSSADLANKVEEINKQYQSLLDGLHLKIVKVVKHFDFQSAKKAHIDWKMKLTNYLQKPDGSLDSKKVCVDNACALGKWIYGEGDKYQATNPRLFDDLKRSHADFHLTAGKIIEYINANNINAAEKLLSPTGHYILISDKTISLIEKLEATTEDKNVA